MKTLIATLATAIALTAPAFADSHAASEKAKAFFAMSNNSAAEILIGETSMGDVTATQIKLALGNMSAAERMKFFEADMSTRLQTLAAQKKLLDGDSAAEGN